MENRTTWGEIPGALKYNFTKELYLYNIENSTTAENINLTMVGPIGYTVNRTFLNPIYDDARKVINYTMESNYTVTEGTLVNIEKTPI